jgi:transposase
MKQGRTERPDVAGRVQQTDAAGVGRDRRMSRQRKTAAVLQLLRGEDLEAVSRSLGVTAATLTAWRDAFLAAGEAALASRPGDARTCAFNGNPNRARWR